MLNTTLECSMLNLHHWNTRHSNIQLIHLPLISAHAHALWLPPLHLSDPSLCAPSSKPRPGSTGQNHDTAYSLGTQEMEILYVEADCDSVRRMMGRSYPWNIFRVPASVLSRVGQGDLIVPLEYSIFM